MSEQQHDAGPWSLVADTDSEQPEVHSFTITAGYPRMDKPIVKAVLEEPAKFENIRVMAAGGMMLDALEKLLDKFEVFIESDWTDEDDQAAYDYARGAVAVARGLKS